MYCTGICIYNAPYSGKLSREKTFTGGSKSTKFVNVFFLESFLLWSMHMCNRYSVFHVILFLTLHNPVCTPLKKSTLYTHIDVWGAADNILDLPPMDGKGVHEYPRVEVPQFDGEVWTSREEVVCVVGLALGVGIEEAVHLALVTLHDAVLRPTWECCLEEGKCNVGAHIHVLN